MTIIRPFLRITAIVACLASALTAPVNAQTAPDLTKGEKPTGPTPKAKDLLISNLGPTGLLGWVYQQGPSTSASRQILVKQILPGSPADGTLKDGDVILGASGSAAKPKPFTNDARKSFGLAIGDAEARTPATLRMLIWREGKTSTASITLETMGAYSATAPYNCPKTLRILAKSLVHADEKEQKLDGYGVNLISLLACNDERLPGNAERMKRAERWVIDLLPTKETLDKMTSNRVETGSKVAWMRTYHLVALAQYYLATGENPSKDGVDLRSAIDAHAQTVARGQSMFGTMGHQFAMQKEDGSIHGPYAVGYGPINSVGLVALVGLNLARECNLPNPKTRAAIDAGMERANRFFSSYTGRGSIPYGEHGPWQGHHANGKNGIAAVAFSRAMGRDDDAKYFSRMAIAEGTERDGGHGGAFFSYLWSPLGSAAGGKAAAAAHFKMISWHLDLSRTWDGGFYYNDYGRSGYNGATFGKAGMFMSSPALLTYALGLEKITLTGSDPRKASELSAAEIQEAVLAANYDPKQRSAEQLLADLGNFSVITRKQAATELAARPEAPTLRPKLETIAADPGHPSRLGAILTLGLIANPESAPVLFGLLGDSQALARDAAVGAIATMPDEIKMREIDKLLKAAAALRRPPMEVHPQDPVNSTLVALNQILFNDKNGLLARGLQCVDVHSTRNQLHEAIRAVASLPSGGERAHLRSVFPWLSTEDVRTLADTLLELIHVESPADAMFADSIKSSCASLLLDHHFIEGVHASIHLHKSLKGWTQVLMMRAWAKHGASLAKLPEAAEINELLNQYNDKNFIIEAQKAIKGMAETGEATPYASLKSK
ncbi:MAG: hypothetical protein RL346_1540 [Verrucomicrobiota bacterium]|jgi:hypothetical protein